jgi:hypothetical protein
VTHCPASFGAEAEAGQIITVVSGLPRSGTSMMMQLLAAAGRETLSDANRPADEDNPLGYFEFEKTLNLSKDSTWLPQARGKTVKIVAQLLPLLPRNEHYHILFMERNLAEVIASQKVMLQRRGRAGTTMDTDQLSSVYAAQLAQVRYQLDRRPEIRILFVGYGELLADPPGAVARVARFLGDPFNQSAAVNSIRPELRRQKA